MLTQVIDMANMKQLTLSVGSITVTGVRRSDDILN